MCKKIWVLEKHKKESEGTGFEECYPCDGFKKPEDGKMLCSRAGATPVQITVAQAQACDGTNPIAQKNAHQVHYLIPPKFGAIAFSMRTISSGS